MKRVGQILKEIEKGMTHFVEVGNALLIIREEKLYKDTFRTFEEYCNERWGFSKSRANQLISATEVSKNLTTMVAISERQIRPLTHLEPEKQKEVWDKAVKTAPEGKVTAKHIQAMERLSVRAGKTKDEEAIQYACSYALEAER